MKNAAESEQVRVECGVRVRLDSIPLMGYFWHLGQRCQRVGAVGGCDIAIKPDGDKVFVPGNWKILPAP